MAVRRVRDRLSIAVVAPLVAPLSAAHPYGNQHFLADLAQALHAMGHDVVVYAAAGSHVDGVEVQAIEIPLAAQRRFVLLRDNESHESSAMAEAFECLFTRLRARGHDAISQHAFDREAILGCDGIPALHTLHLPPMSPPVVATVRATDSALCSVSRSCAKQWREAVGRHVHALPNGVPRFEAPAASVSDIALIAGRISREKGVTTAIRAARRAWLRPRVVGEVYDRDYFDEEVAPLLDGEVVMPPLSRLALAREMARAGAVLMPVEWDEPFGLVAAEALRVGCPVIGYRRGALPEIVRDGDGILVDPGDENALVDALCRVHRLDRTEIRRRAAHRFDMFVCARRYEAALHGLARGWM